MGQLNKVISVFLLLGVAILVLWFMLTRAQTLRNLFNNSIPLTQVFTRSRNLTQTPSPTNTPTSFSAEAEKALAENKDNGQTTKGGQVQVLGNQTVKTPTPKPTIKTYPNTGAEAYILPVLVTMLASGFFVLKKTQV